MNGIEWTARQVRALQKAEESRPRPAPKAGVEQASHPALLAGTKADALYREFQDRRGWRPTVSEVCDLMGWTKTQGWSVLRALRTRGLLGSNRPGQAKRGQPVVEATFWMLDVDDV